ncbi:hypothetical protein EW145_g5055 [Phellinidium pouzarii]|uniref:RGS domain-containing protein n=1 Tax=Phellinidium pouzarii TaxID=167371 RepID=A0A4S4L1C8_9AGAM|nr:hypothetical protein EW145_g5055 [Phellinidium pouzarii]
MAFRLSFPFRRHKQPEHASASASEESASFPVAPLSSLERGRRNPPTYAACLWQWAADANRSRLSHITLAHVLSGDTVSPISLSDFEAFLAFCDISLENLLFIVWFQDYRARFDALPVGVQIRSPPPEGLDQHRGKRMNNRMDTNSVDVPARSTTGVGPPDTMSTEENKRSETHLLTVKRLTSAAQISALSGPEADIYQSVTSTAQQAPSISPAHVHFENAGMRSDADDQIVELDISSLRSYGAVNTISSSSTPYGCEASSHMFVSPLQLDSLSSSPYTLPQWLKHPVGQPFRSEVQNILATFFVPGSKKELSLSAEMRDRVIRGVARTTHPGVFYSVYEAIYDSIESVSLPRFLAQATTNINRPRQLFWYLSAIPTFLVGLALVLWIIFSPSHLLTVPPEFHRAWRLVSVPFFLLASMMWYKGFRGFCPILFLRSSTQLRVWELEAMADDDEAQQYCSYIAKDRKEVNGVPSTPTNMTSPISRIAPFLDDGVPKQHGADVPIDSSPSETSGDSDTTSDSEGQNARAARCDDTWSRAHVGRRFRRPPIFGPDHVVEDARIRSVHMNLWWSLVRFGLFWATVSAAIVVSVPSRRHAS